MRPLVGVPCRTLVADESTFYAIASAYTRALDLAGAAPVLIPLGLGTETLYDLYARLDGLLLAGGADVHPREFGEEVHARCGDIHPERDVVELQLIRWALADAKPLLGICRGIQMLNVAAGGSLYQDIATQLPEALRHAYHPGDSFGRRVHSIAIDPVSRLGAVLGARVDVNSLHHQAVKQVAPGFHVVAHAPDGIVEGIEANDGHLALGVQFHPERLVDEDARMVDLFRILVTACRPA